MKRATYTAEYRAAERLRATVPFKSADMKGHSQLGSDRLVLLSLIAMDAGSRPVRMPEVTFIKRRLPGEDRWGRERLPMREVTS